MGKSYLETLSHRYFLSGDVLHRWHCLWWVVQRPETQCAGFALPIAVVIPLTFVALTRQRGNAGTLELWAASAWPWYHVGYILDMWEATA